MYFCSRTACEQRGGRHFPFPAQRNRIHFQWDPSNWGNNRRLQYKINDNYFKALWLKGTQFRNSSEHFHRRSFDNTLVHSLPMEKLEALISWFFFSLPRLISVPMFGRCNVNISPVSCVFSGCHASLLQTFIRVTGKKDGLIFDGKAKKKWGHCLFQESSD